jgi:hypothetical protein
MTLDELYTHFDYNWARMARELGFGTHTIYLWRTRYGRIPERAQKLIEYRTNGTFKADKITKE